MDRSLKGANALVRHRNVLNRAERLDKLKEEEKWDEGKSVFGLPKVAHRKMALAKTAKEEEAAEAAPGTPAAAGAAAPAAGAAAPAGKGAAPAAGKGAPAAAGKGAPAAKAAPAKGKK